MFDKFTYNINFDQVLTDEKTINSYKKQIEIADRLQGHYGKMDALENLGIIYTKLEDYHTAIAYFFQQLTIAINIENDLKIITSLNNLAFIYIKLNKLHDAESCLQHILKIAEVYNDTNKIAETSLALSQIQQILQQTQNV